MRLLTVAFVVLAATALLASVVGAQESQDAVAQLENENVAFEDGALSNTELGELDEATAKLQDGDGYFKVIVLGEPITRYSDAGTYANSVRTGLGGEGRVLVFAPFDGDETEVGLSSNLDTSAQVAEAEQAALDDWNGNGSYADATNAAARQLSSDVADKAGGGGGGSGLGVFLLILLLLGLAVLGFMWWASRRMQKSAAAASAKEIGVAEAKVRAKVDEVANELLDLADRVDQPGAPAEAKAAFAQGAELFTTTQELLEEADTRPELEAAYPEVVEAGWHMDTARALLDGQPAPAKPEPEDLFPQVVVPAASEPAATTAGFPAPRAQVPEPHYRQPGASPWITAAAMAAMAMLSQRGMSVPQTRPSMDDGAFGSWSSRLPSGPSSGRDRGRSGGGGVTSSQRRRGMNRR
jgi:hypothetical protein